MSEGSDDDYTTAERNSRLKPIPVHRKFNTLRQYAEELRSLQSPPRTLWERAYVGEVLSDADECHPSNSSFSIGALGGALVGFGTGFFSPKRVYQPVRIPIPFNLFPTVHKALTFFVIGGSIGWKITKRVAIAAILYSVLECDFRDQLNDNLKGSMAAGAVSGAVFGIRGGLTGIFMGASGFAVLPAVYKIYYGYSN